MRKSLTAAQSKVLLQSRAQWRSNDVRPYIDRPIAVFALGNFIFFTLYIYLSQPAACTTAEEKCRYNIRSVDTIYKRSVDTIYAALNLHEAELAVDVLTDSVCGQIESFIKVCPRKSTCENPILHLLGLSK